MGYLSKTAFENVCILSRIYLVPAASREDAPFPNIAKLWDHRSRSGFGPDSFNP